MNDFCSAFRVVRWKFRNRDISQKWRIRRSERERGY